MALYLGSRGAKAKQKGAIKESVKPLSYNPSTNRLLLDISDSTTESTTSIANAGIVEVENTGKIPALIQAAYQFWTDEDTMNTNSYTINFLLRPNDRIELPDCPAFIQDQDVEIYEGEALDNQVPDANMYVDSTADQEDGTGDDITGSASETKVFFEPHTSATNNAGLLFKVGDLIRVNNEIMEITELGSMGDAANTYATVIRGVHGSTAASDHADDDAIRFPFFNAYHDFDKFSTAQTDLDGKYKCTNFFGYGRSLTAIDGITAGSVCIKFYESGYQSLGMSGVTNNTESGLAASTEYKFNITVDGGSTFSNLTFTTGSSTKFGGSDGVINKIQSALNTQYYTAGNLLNKRVYVAIVDGDIRFTSGTRLSTSAILLAAPTSGTTPFGVGRVPAIGDVNAAVAARLPDDVSYDPVTYQSYPNSDVFIYDDGYGNLFGNCAEGSSINYETGAVDMIGCPPEANFVVSALYSSPLSGRQSATHTKRNGLSAIYGNLTSQKGEGEVTIKRK